MRRRESMAIIYLYLLLAPPPRPPSLSLFCIKHPSQALAWFSFIHTMGPLPASSRTSVGRDERNGVSIKLAQSEPGLPFICYLPRAENGRHRTATCTLPCCAMVLRAPALRTGLVGNKIVMAGGVHGGKRRANREYTTNKP